MPTTEIYVSTDIETDGPAPGINSMLSFGSAAYLADKTVVDTFSANLETLPDTVANEKTMQWWKTQPDAWKACRENCLPAAQAMQSYCDWLKALPGRPIFVGYPVGFDFPFIQYYLQHFADENPFGFATIDIRSFVMGSRGKEYRKSGKQYLPKRVFDDLPHTHVALDDALEQGALFCNLLAERAAEAS